MGALLKPLLSTLLIGICLGNVLSEKWQLADENGDQNAQRVSMRDVFLGNVTINGTSYILNTDACTGGVMFKKRIPVDQFCGFGVFHARTSGCVNGNETVAGAHGKYACTSFPEGVQALLVVEGEANFEDLVHEEMRTTEATTTGLLEHNSLLEKRSASKFHDKDITTRETVVDERPLLDVEVNFPEPPSRERYLVKRNSDAHALMARETEMNLNDEEDTLPLEETGADAIQTQPVGFKVVDETDIDEEDGDTVAITDHDNGHSSLAGRVYSSVESGEEAHPLDFSHKDEEYSEFSSEKDEGGGDWDLPVEPIDPILPYPPRYSGEESTEIVIDVPQKGTVEYDALTGGLDKWIEMPTSSPLFDAHLTLLRDQIDFELLHMGTHPEENGGNPAPAHVSVISQKHVAYNTTWFLILAEIATTASVLIPDDLFRDPFSVGGNGIGKGKVSDGGVQMPIDYLFDDILRVFSFFARSYDAGEMNLDVVFGLVDGFLKCREEAEAFVRGCVVGTQGGGDCEVGEVELKSMQIREPVWNEINATYTYVNRTLDFTSGDFQYSETRINPTRWIFAELMWYAVQITYMFCFETFSTVNPNSFMVAYDIVLKLFESDLVSGLWEETGGNLGVFELLLPYVKRGLGGRVVEDEFRGLLEQLDRIAGGIRTGSIVGGFEKRKKSGRRGKIKNSWDVGRRRKRDVAEEYDELVKKMEEGDGDDFWSSEGLIESVQHKDGGSKRDALGTSGHHNVGLFENLGSDGVIKRKIQDVDVVDMNRHGGVNVDNSNVFGNGNDRVATDLSKSSLSSNAARKRGVVSEDVVSEGGQDMDDRLAGNLESSVSGNDGIGVSKFTDNVPRTKNVFSQTGWISRATTRSSVDSKTQNGQKTEESSLETFAGTNTPALQTSSTITPVTSISAGPSLIEYDTDLKQFEIWGGLAYCLEVDDRGDLSPSFEELKRAGVCDNG